MSYQKLVYLVSANMNDKFYLEGTQRVGIRGHIAHELKEGDRVFWIKLGPTPGGFPKRRFHHRIRI